MGGENEEKDWRAGEDWKAVEEEWNAGEGERRCREEVLLQQVTVFSLAIFHLLLPEGL